MKKRFSIACLLLAILASGVLVGCGNKTTAETEPDTVAAVQTETETETEATWKTTLPDTDMGGWECRVLTIRGEGYAVTTCFKPEELTGEIVNDAMYNRDRDIEDKFNMTFTEHGREYFWETTDEMKKYVLAGSDDYQLNMLIQRDAFALSLEGHLMPVDMLTHVQPEMPWYAQSVNTAMQLGENQYILYSAECLNLYEQACMVLYNKNIWEMTSGMRESAYQLVRDGKWTYDLFMRTAEAAIADLNGDGKVSDNDRLGIVSEIDFFYPSMWVGAGFQMIEMENGTPVFTVGQNEQLLGFLTDMLRARTTEGLYFDSYEDEGVAFTQYGYDERSRTTSRQIFESGAAAYLVHGVFDIQHIREMEDNFGVLPLPKYDEAQAQYCSRIIDGWLNVVPVTNQQPENTSLILESLAEESYRSVLPAYMEVALKDKYTRDPDSAEMLDLVFSTTTVELGDTVWQGDVRNEYVNICASGKDTFASKTASVQQRIDNTIATAMEKLAELENN